MTDRLEAEKQKLWRDFLASIRSPGTSPKVSVAAVNNHVAAAFFILAMHFETAWPLAFPDGANANADNLAATYTALDTKVVNNTLLQAVVGLKQLFGDINGAWKIISNHYEPEPCPDVEKMNRLIEFTKTL